MSTMCSMCSSMKIVIVVSDFKEWLGVQCVIRSVTELKSRNDRIWLKLIRSLDRSHFQTETHNLMFKFLTTPARVKFSILRRKMLFCLIRRRLVENYSKWLWGESSIVWNVLSVLFKQRRETPTCGLWANGLQIISTNRTLYLITATLNCSWPLCETTVSLCRSFSRINHW